MSGLAAAGGGASNNNSKEAELEEEIQEQQPIIFDIGSLAEDFRDSQLQQHLDYVGVVDGESDKQPQEANPPSSIPRGGSQRLNNFFGGEGGGEGGEGEEEVMDETKEGGKGGGEEQEVIMGGAGGGGGAEGVAMPVAKGKPLQRRRTRQITQKQLNLQLLRNLTGTNFREGNISQEEVQAELSAYYNQQDRNAWARDSAKVLARLLEEGGYETPSPVVPARAAAGAAAAGSGPAAAGADAPLTPPQISQPVPGSDSLGASAHGERQGTNDRTQCQFLHGPARICYACMGPFFPTQIRIFGRAWMARNYIIRWNQDRCFFEAYKGMGNNSPEHFGRSIFMSAVTGQVPTNGDNFHGSSLFNLQQAFLDWMHYNENSVKNDTNPLLLDREQGLRISMKNIVRLINLNWNGQTTDVRFVGQLNTRVYYIEDNGTQTPLHHPSHLVCYVLQKLHRVPLSQIVDRWKLEQTIRYWLRAYYIKHYALLAAGNHNRLLVILQYRFQNPQDPNEEWAKKDKVPTTGNLQYNKEISEAAKNLRIRGRVNWFGLLNSLGIPQFNPETSWDNHPELRDNFCSDLWNYCKTKENRNTPDPSVNPLYWLARLSKGNPLSLDIIREISNNFSPPNRLRVGEIQGHLKENHAATAEALRKYNAHERQNVEFAQKILSECTIVGDQTFKDTLGNDDTKKKAARVAVQELVKRKVKLERDRLIGHDGGGAEGGSAMGNEKQRKTRQRKRTTRKRKTRKNHR